MSNAIDTDLALSALEMALFARRPLDGLVHHSEQGVQYASERYVETLRTWKVVPSMSAKGNPYGNAKAESFFKTLKAEEVNLKERSDDLEHARREIAHFIEDVYNAKRLHSRLGYRQFENLHA